MSWHSKTWYEIGVYWPNDGAYGIPDIANTEEQARAKKEFAERNGYNVPGKSEVHIRPADKFGEPPHGQPGAAIFGET